MNLAFGLVVRFWPFTAAAALCGASLLPGTAASVLLGWLTAVFIALGATRERFVARMFVFGVLFHLSAFYWIPETLSRFGNYPVILSLVIFAFFALLSSIQFFMAGWVAMRLSPVLGRLHLDVATGWLVAEVLVPRLFPWALGQSQLGWENLSAFAEVQGVEPVSALMIWVAACALPPYRKAPILAATAATVAVVGGGWLRNSQLQQELADAPRVAVALIQGNFAAKGSAGARYFEADVPLYRRLSDRAAENGAQLVIWPEAMIGIWAPRYGAESRGTRFDVWPGGKVPLLYGGIFLRPPENGDFTTKALEPAAKSMRLPGGKTGVKLFNGAFGREPGGRIIARYYKRVLIPLGEFLPFAQYFPQLRSLVPSSGDVSRGTSADVFRFLLKPGSGVEQVTLAPLICYEDLIPSLSALAAQNGAEVLVNLTNDAWFGDTAAPHQHNLLAAWRAIETRRYFLRATNTGKTAVIDPFGQTVAALPAFTEGVLEYEIAPLRSGTIFTIFGNTPLRITVVMILLYVFLRRRKGQETAPQRE